MIYDKHNVYPSGGEYYPHVDNSYCSRKADMIGLD